MTDSPVIGGSDSPAASGGDLESAQEFSAGASVVKSRVGSFGVHDAGDVTGYNRLVRHVVLPGPSERPYGGWFDALVDDLAAALQRRGVAYSDAVEKVVVDRNELTLHIARTHIVTVSSALRDEASLRFELSLGVSGVHWPEESGAELHAVYHLCSITHNKRVRLEVTAPDSDPHIPSTVGVYPTNDFHERETFDFFGIVFDGHPHLTRIMMPDDWPGHPQRKDYPLGGIPVEYKGATIAPPETRRSYS